MGLRTGPHHYEYHGTMPVLNCLFDNHCGTMQVVQVLSALLANWATSYGEPPFGVSHLLCLPASDSTFCAGLLKICAVCLELIDLLLFQFRWLSLLPTNAYHC